MQPTTYRDFPTAEDRQVLNEIVRDYADKLDSILAFGDLIDASTLTGGASLVLGAAVDDGYLIRSNSSNPTPLYKLTESGRRFLSEYASAGKPKRAADIEVQLEDAGDVWHFAPISKAGSAWVAENVVTPACPFGIVEHKNAGALIERMTAGGLRVRVL